MKYLDVRYYAFGIANKLYNIMNFSHQKRYEVFYRYYLLFTSITQIVIFIASGILLGILKEICIAALSFIILRRYAGGIHSKTMWQCTFHSLVIFLTSVYVGQLINLYIIYSLNLIGLILIIIFSPSDNIHKPVVENKRQSLKYKSIATYLIILSTSLLLPNYKGIITIALFMECLTLIKVCCAAPKINIQEDLQ